MSQPPTITEATKLVWHEQRTLFCPDGTRLFAIEPGFWVRSLRAGGGRSEGYAVNLEAAVAEVSRDQQLGGREWMRSHGANAGGGVLVYVYPVKGDWSAVIKVGGAGKLVGKFPTEEAAKRGAETMLNKARMRAAMPSVVQTWGRG